MENITKKQNAFLSEEEKTLNWKEIQSAFENISEVYNNGYRRSF